MQERVQVELGQVAEWQSKEFGAARNRGALLYPECFLCLTPACFDFQGIGARLQQAYVQFADNGIGCKIGPMDYISLLIVHPEAGRLLVVMGNGQAVLAAFGSMEQAVLERGCRRSPAAGAFKRIRACRAI